MIQIIIGIFIGIALLTLLAMLSPTPNFSSYHPKMCCSHWDYDMVKLKNQRLEMDNYRLRENNRQNRMYFPIRYYSLGIDYIQEKKGEMVTIQISKKSLEGIKNYKIIK